MSQRFTVDPEWNGEEFWENARTAPDCPAFLKAVIHGKKDEVILSERDADKAIDWINGIVGSNEYCNDFSNGPFVINPVGREQK